MSGGRSSFLKMDYKYIVIPVGIVAGTLALWASFSYFTGRHAVENAKYTILSQLPSGIQIRYYPPSIAATVTVEAHTMIEAGNKGFRYLARFIFGANTARSGGSSSKISMTSPVVSEAPLLTSTSGGAQKISMTSPVVMEGGAGPAASAGGLHTVSFIMPSQYQSLEDLPTPLEPSVKLRQLPPRMNGATAASRGSAVAPTRARTQASCASGGRTHSVISR